MKTKTLLRVLAAVSLLTVISCEQEIAPVDTPVRNTPEVKTYTMSVVAGKGGSATKALTDNGVTLSNGWYVVDKNLTFNKRITISGTVNIILMDNTRLMANNGIYVPINTTLHIWGQSNKLTNPDDMMGIINATAKDKDYSGIGGNQWGICSGILITGGNVIGMGGVYGAGIGSGFCGTMHERKGGFRRRYRDCPRIL